MEEARCKCESCYLYGIQHCLSTSLMFWLEKMNEKTCADCHCCLVLVQLTGLLKYVGSVLNIGIFLL